MEMTSIIYYIYTYVNVACCIMRSFEGALGANEVFDLPGSPKFSSSPGCCS